MQINNIEVTTRSPFLGGDIFKEKYKKETLSKLNLKSDDNYSSDIIKWIKKFKTIKSIVLEQVILTNFNQYLRHK